MSVINDVNQIGAAMRGMAMALHSDTSPAPGSLSSLRTFLFARSNSRALYNLNNVPAKIYFFKAMSLNGYSNSDIALALTESNNAGQVGNGMRRLAGINASAFSDRLFFPMAQKQRLTELIAVERRATGTTSRRARTSTIAPTRTTTTTTRTTTPRAASTSRAQGLVRDVPFSGTIGVEFEIFGVPRSQIIEAFRKKKLNIESESYNHTTRSYWKIVYDASVTGSEGCEVVSPVLTGTRGLVDLRRALQALSDCGALVNRSTGLHVHFGASGLSLQQWKNLLINYHGLEPIIDQMMQTTRRNNQYAQSLTTIRDFVSKVQSDSSFNELRNTLGTRYRKVNLESFDRHGTVEFRQHAGNVEIDSVINWVLFLHYLIEVSKRRTLSNFTFANIENFTPKPLSAWIHNRIYDLSNVTYKS